MHKRSKSKNKIKPDLMVNIKAARIKCKRVKMIKSQLSFRKEMLRKRQSTVEDIFKDVDVKNDVVCREEYS